LKNLNTQLSTNYGSVCNYCGLYLIFKEALADYKNGYTLVVRFLQKQNSIATTTYLYSLAQKNNYSVFEIGEFQKFQLKINSCTAS
jgi:hypothetical protein